MAMVFDLGVPQEEVQAIAGFLASKGGAEIPRVGEAGNRLLEAVTSAQASGFWTTTIGRFVEYTPDGTSYRTPDNERAAMADSLMGDDGQPSGRYGVVVEDLEQPTGAFLVGVPI